MTFRFLDLPVILSGIDPILDQIIVEQYSTQTTKRASIELVIPALVFTMNNQVGLNYDALRVDALNSVITMNNASANTVTILPFNDLTSNIPVGSLLLVRQIGAGSTSFLAGSGVTIQTPGTAIARVQYSMISALHEALNVWRIAGDYL